MSTSSSSEIENSTRPIEVLESATVRLCGDSGDGMQLAGTQLTNTSALAGNDVATFPDFPAEIRAPRGTLAGVSGFQVHFASNDIFTPGDRLDALIAMNPAALKTNLADLKPGGILIVDEDSFSDKDLDKANYKENPLEDDSLAEYKLIKAPITKLTREAVKELGLSQKISDRCRNFFAMGLIYFLYGRDMDPTLRFIENKFGKMPDIADANRRTLNAGWNYGDTIQEFASTYQVEKAKLDPGDYRNVTGNQALAWGLIAASKMSGKNIFLGTYPITPASDILHELSKYKNFDVRTFQAEDEIAACCSIVGAAFAGAMGVTASSGPGIALKGEAMGLGLMLELPMLIINIQRGGPSTGLPTKTEQADLYQAMYGRNGEAPLPVISCSSPSDCFEVAQEAWKVAVRLMTPVIILSDGYIANGAEPWRIPNAESLDKIEIKHPGPREADADPFMPYQRDELLARPWALPGTPGLMHRLGGLEKQDVTGNVSYDPDNHQHMVNTRAKKVENVRKLIGPQSVDGPEEGDLLVLSWGGTYGACTTACKRARNKGLSVAHAHLRWLNPMPENLAELMGKYKNVLVPELNMGQLRTLIRGTYLVDAIGYNKVQGKPFSVEELVEKIEEVVKS